MNKSKLKNLSTEDNEWKKYIKNIKKRHFKALKMASVVSSVALIFILINRAELTSNKMLLFAFFAFFIISYFVFVLLFKLPSVINELGLVVDGLIPKTAYLSGNNGYIYKKDLKRRIIEWCGILLFIIVFNFFIVFGIFIGYFVLSIGGTSEIMLYFSDFIKNYIFSTSIEGYSISFVIFILFFVFPVMYSKRVIKHDPALNIKQISVKYVFNRIMIMWLSLARGNDVLLNNRSEGNYKLFFIKKIFLSLIIGSIVDFFLGRIAATPIIVLITCVYVFLLYIYKIDPAKENSHNFKFDR